MERGGRAGPLPDAGLGGTHLHGLGRRPARQPRRPRDQEGRPGAISSVRGALPVKVKVLFFASLREQLGVAQETLDVPGDVNSVEKLKNHLRTRGGAFEKAFGGK